MRKQADADARFTTVVKERSTYTTDSGIDRLALARRNAAVMHKQGWEPSTIVYFLGDLIEICDWCGWPVDDHAVCAL